MSTRTEVFGLAKAVAVLVALLSVCACQYDPYTLSYATAKPNPEEVIGHWVATDRTLRDLASGHYQNARPTIEVSRDGSIRMTDIPDRWRTESGDGAGQIETFAGTWQLQKYQDRWWGLQLR